jgi:hypothetical protein
MTKRSKNPQKNTKFLATIASTFLQNAASKGISSLIKKSEGNTKSTKRRTRGGTKSGNIPAGISTFTAGRPIFQNGSTGGLRLKHMERWLDVSNATSNVSSVVSGIFVPGTSGIPVLDSIAKTFDRYRISSICIHFRTSLGTTNNGSIVLGVDWNADNNPPAFPEGIESFYPNIRGPVWKDLDLPIPSDRLMSRTFYKIPTGTLQGVVLFDCAPFQFHAGIECEATYQIGEIWVSYDVTFDGPQVPNVGTLGGWISRALTCQMSSWLINPGSTTAVLQDYNTGGVGCGLVATVDTSLGSDGLPTQTETSTSHDFITKGGFTISPANWPSGNGYYFDSTNLTHNWVMQLVNSSQQNIIPFNLPIQVIVRVLADSQGSAAAYCRVYGFAQSTISNSIPGYASIQGLAYNIATTGPTTAPTNYSSYGSMTTYTFSYIGYLSSDQTGTTTAATPAIVFTKPVSSMSSSNTCPVSIDAFMAPCVPFNYQSSGGVSSLTGALKYSKYHARTNKMLSRFRERTLLPNVKLHGVDPICQDTCLRESISRLDIDSESDF